jgi:serine/threonine protein kinase
VLTVKDRFRTIETLETGRDAVVYLADDVASNRRVLVTVLSAEAAADRDFVAAVRQQVHRIGKLEDPSRAILPLHALDVTDDGQVVVATEAAPGRSLRAMLDQGGALDPSSTLRLAVRIGEALETLHHHGIVHGSLRPECVFLAKEEDGTERVKLRGVELASARWTAAGRRLRDETLMPYVAPEQIDRAETSEAADIHALGLLIQELLTGERPSGTGRRLRPAGDLPATIGGIVAKALETRPEQRYANVSLMVNDLWSAENEPPRSETPSVTHVLNERRAAARRRARSDVGMVIALAVGLVLVGVTAWVVRSDRLAGSVRTELAEPSLAASPVGTPASPSSANAVLTQPLRPPVAVAAPVIEEKRPVAATSDAPAPRDREAVVTPPPPRTVVKQSPPAVVPPARLGRRGSEADGSRIIRRGSEADGSTIIRRGSEADGSAIIDWLLQGRGSGS